MVPKYFDMLTKEKVQQQLVSMPDEFTLDDFIDKLILLAKIKEGINDSVNNRSTSHANIKKEIDS